MKSLEKPFYLLSNIEKYTRSLPVTNDALRATFEWDLQLHSQRLRCRVVVSGQVINVVIVVDVIVSNWVISHALFVLRKRQDFAPMGYGLDVVFVCMRGLEQATLECRRGFDQTRINW